MTTVAQEVHTIHLNQTQIIIPLLRDILQQLVGPVSGQFNPPPELVKVAKVEVFMSVLEVQVGQTKTSKMTFDESTAPADGAVMSDDTAVATISLDSDMVTWHCVGVAVGTATMSYTGTSASPDVGAAVVPPMTVTVVAVPVAEHGDFDPSHAVATGP